MKKHKKNKKELADTLPPLWKNLQSVGHVMDTEKDLRTLVFKFQEQNNIV